MGKGTGGGYAFPSNIIVISQKEKEREKGPGKILTETRLQKGCIKGYTTICPISSDPFYIVSYYIKWATTSLETMKALYWYTVYPRSSSFYKVSYGIKWVTTSRTHSSDKQLKTFLETMKAMNWYIESVKITCKQKEREVYPPPPVFPKQLRSISPQYD